MNHWKKTVNCPSQRTLAAEAITELEAVMDDLREIVALVEKEGRRRKMSNELPQAWATTTLGDLFDFKYGKSLPQEKRNAKGSIKVFGSNGVVGAHNSALTKGPTIIVGRKGSVGEVHFHLMACWPIDTTYFIDEFPEKLPPTYWALYLKSLRLGQQEKSSAIPGISRTDVYEVEVAMPPVAEQQRIMAKLKSC